MRDEPALQPLIDRYGHAAVWRACEQVNGCPPTWQLTGSQFLNVAEYLEANS